MATPTAEQLAAAVKKATVKYLDGKTVFSVGVGPDGVVIAMAPEARKTFTDTEIDGIPIVTREGTWPEPAQVS